MKPITIPLARPPMTADMKRAALAALSEERLTLGESVMEFEDRFARFIGTDYAVAVSSGAMALQLTLQAAQVTQSHEVLTTPLSFIASANAAVAVGARPTFADIEPSSYTLDPAKVPRAITPASRVLLPVHIYGHPCQMDVLLEEARRHGLFVLEDAAQAHGARYRGKRVGSWGDAAAFSFYPTKNLHVGGDGGMVTTNDARLAKAVAKLRHSGRSGTYEHDVIGTTARLNTVNAAIGLAALRHLPKWNERRVDIARRYTRLLRGVGDLVLPPLPDKEFRPVYHLYTVETASRDALRDFLTMRGIDTGIHYPIPIHLQPIYRELYGYAEGAYPVAEAHCRRTLSLPLFPELTDRQVQTVAEAVTDFFG